jgi:hypothetical protein
LAEDYLSQLPLDKVKDWYKRLGTKFSVSVPGVTSPMAGRFLLHWLGEDGNRIGETLQLQIPEHLASDPSVTSVLQFHRQVFLTEKKGDFGAKKLLGIIVPGQHVTRWAGIIPRIQSKQWRPGTKAAPTMLSLVYESLSDIAPGIVDIYRIQRSGTAVQRDIATSLRGWQLKSEVSLKGYVNEKGLISVMFLSWMASGTDRYDFNFGEHLTVPNPDFGSKDRDAVRPQDQTLRVFHANAKRLEKAKLAAPYSIAIDRWVVRNPALLGPAEVDAKKQISN